MTALNSPVTNNDIIEKVNELDARDALPSQTGHSGEYLTTNGSEASWGTVETFPSQEGNAGKFLTTNGTDTSWGDPLPAQAGQSGKVLSTNGATASWEASDSLKNLTSTLTEEITTFGTYNGNEVENNTVFTSDEGTFKEFTKELKTGDTEFTEKESFPGSNGDLFVTRIVRSVGGVDTPFYMAVGDGKVFTSNDGVFSSTATSTTGTALQKAPLYLNGVWLIRNIYGLPSFSNNDGASWTVRSSGTYPALMNNYGVVGDYFYICSEANKYTLSQDADTWTKYSFTKATDLAYDGEYYYLLSENKIYKTTTPTDVDSWVLVTTVTNISSQPSFLKYNNGTFYTCYQMGYYDERKYKYFYTDDITSTTWTEFSRTFGGNYDSNAKTWLEFIGDLVFVFVHDSNNVDTLYQTTATGQDPVEITNPSQYASVVGDELWYITGGNVYSLNPNPRWVYSLTDLLTELSDIAQAGAGITFEGGTTTTENFTKTGSPTINDGIYSNISNSNNIVANTAFQPSTNTWEFVTKITTGNTVSDEHFLIGGSESGTKYPQIGIANSTFYMAASYTGANWDINTQGSSVTANTTYWIKALYDGSYYKIQYKTNEADAWSDGLSVSSSTALTIPNINMAIGWYYGQSFEFNGSIDLNETYLKIGDDIVWTPYTTVTTDKPTITLDVATNQANAPTSSTVGYVGKLYVTTGGAVYICTGVSGSTYTWAQVSVS